MEKKKEIPKIPKSMIKNRTFKNKLTIKEAIKNKIKITDLIPKDKLKKLPIELSWRMILKMSNAMIESGDNLTINSDMFEVLAVFTEALKSAFLVNNSPM